MNRYQQISNSLMTRASVFAALSAATALSTTAATALSTTAAATLASATRLSTCSSANPVMSTSRADTGNRRRVCC